MSTRALRGEYFINSLNQLEKKINLINRPKRN